MSDDTFNGDALRKQRIELGYTQADIYRLIHIPCNYTEALETGNLTTLPGPTYARGFLRTYCLFLQLDPDLFEDKLHLRMKQAPAPTGTWKPTKKNRDNQPSWKTEFATWGAICAILLLAWLTYTAMIQPWANEAAKRVDAATDVHLPPANAKEQF